MMRVSAESLTTLHRVFVNDPQAAEPHVLRVVVVCERERVVTVQPAVVAMASFIGSANCNHKMVLWFGVAQSPLHLVATL